MGYHYLRPNKTTALPAQVLYLDTETSPVTTIDGVEYHTADIAVTCFARYRPKRNGWVYEWRRWNNPLEIPAYIDRKIRGKTRLYIIASNPTFDCWVIDAYRRLHRLGWRLQFFYDKGLVHILRANKRNKSICILAIQNFYPVGVEAIGKMVGLPKLKVDVKTVSGEERWAYCRRDVEVLIRGFELWLEFTVSHNMGGFSLTKTGQAMRCFRHRFMNRKILIHDHPTSIELERASYFGGRTEAFVLGRFTDGPFTILDVHSMYPFIMATSLLPYHLEEVRSLPPVDWVRSRLQDYALVAEVELETEHPAFPVRLNKRTVFPTGNFVATLCTEGLRYAFEHCHIHRVCSVAVFQKAPLFQDFMNYFYELRQEYKATSNYPFDQCCKYLLNSFYGKWAQRYAAVSSSCRVDQLVLGRERVLDYETRVWSVVTVLMGKQWTETGKVEGHNNFVAISAHITEAGRLMLWNLINRLPRGRVLYCDTDSIMIRSSDLPVFADVIDPFRLGALGIDKESDEVDIRGLKDYTWNGRDIIKGIRKDAERLSPSRFRQYTFPGLYTLLESAPPGCFPIVYREKVLKRKYTKGLVGGPLGLVSPFRLNTL